MPKMKTHKGTAKVVKVRPSGKISIGRAGKLHKNGKKSAKHDRKMRTTQTLSKPDERRIKSLITYR